MGRIVSDIGHASDVKVALPTALKSGDAPPAPTAPLEHQNLGNPLSASGSQSGISSAVASEEIERRREKASRGLGDISPAPSPADIKTALEAAEQRGYEKGQETAARESATLLDRQRAEFKQVLDALIASRETLLSEAQDDIVEAAFSAVCKILSTKLVDPRIAGEAVLSTLARLRNGHPTLIVTISSTVKRWVESASSEHLNQLQGVEFEVDEALLPGGCLVKSTRGSLDARLDSQLMALKRILIDCRELAGRQESPP